MQSRKEALDYGLAFPDTYVETPFVILTGS